METKNENPVQLLAEINTHHILELLFASFHLKQLYRQGWLKRGIPKENCESVADHSFGVALLAYVVANEYLPHLDLSKVMKLAIMHDLAEVYVGDLTPHDSVNINEKEDRETFAFERLFSKFPNPQTYISLWEEYRDQSSPEAVFVKQIDKLEMAVQAGIYEGQNFENLGEFFPHVQERVHEPQIKNLLEELLILRT